ncbi:hypothetical protein Z517_03657 [Fonsecaea pedrosoi CBS 271.37]|uniref:Uncharacterized protein n=1 Tax=Fonsecaea pedrosoi CBS 271.37 TaxID=1442368 RepID=A0A0D2FCS0_9EURO|nr:uncharacterized protein Z517_03657 [Fonsecaea pedrosoi CBS 271.37]KIW84407.1 hypothetical protein Z517_03657 [Fonsecaea pedrosoi CBS 271.37]
MVMVKGTSDFAGSVDLIVVVTTVVNVVDVDATVDADVDVNIITPFPTCPTNRSIDRSATGHAMAVKNMLQTGHLLNAFTRKWGNGIILLLPPGFDKLLHNGGITRVNTIAKALHDTLDDEPLGTICQLLETKILTPVLQGTRVHLELTSAPGVPFQQTRLETASVIRGHKKPQDKPYLSPSSSPSGGHPLAAAAGMHARSPLSHAMA